MVTLTITSGDRHLKIEITEGRASGVFRDTSADTTLNLDRVPLALIGQLCPGIFDCFRKHDEY